MTLGLLGIRLTLNQDQEGCAPLKLACENARITTELANRRS
jgi:hypothetical protein